MTANNRGLLKAIVMAAVVLLGRAMAPACGGFFCQQVPINQAGEQIIFRQDGDTVTAIILIQYAGSADDFSWVVPVPGIPELSTGSDLVFSSLELATRPQFTLLTNGEPCLPADAGFGGFFSNAAPPDSESTDGGVEVLQRLAVGPFDVEVVRSDDPEALAVWLDTHNYDLTDRGRELIAPYVADGMNFVALRLQQNRGVGDIQPLIMRYTSDEPMIPIRLTAVAAQPDMGVLVWLLGASRSVPLNYLHVTPNYTRLNWYAGTQNAFASYQGLITAAMDEAGGQGFATDFASRDLKAMRSQLPAVQTFSDELIRLAAIADDAQFVAETLFGLPFPQDKALEIVRRALPLPAGQDEFVYQVPELLNDLFDAPTLSAAREMIVEELNTSMIGPLEETLAVFDGDVYMTRFFTTLSPEEMTLDPTFSFNPDLGDQSLERQATMDVSCNQWSLTLGPGTGRDGELVIEGTGQPPGFSVVPVIDQGDVWRTEMLPISGQPQMVTQKSFAVAQVQGETVSPPFPLLCGSGTGLCGTGILGMLGATFLCLRFMRSRHRP